MKYSYLRFLLSGATIWITAGISIAAELRLVAFVDGGSIPVVGVENNRIVGTRGGNKVLLTRNTNYQLEGDLSAAPETVYWSPSYTIKQGAELIKAGKPGVFAIAHAGLRHLAEMDGKKMPSEFLENWPAGAPAGGLMVFAWLVDGKIAQLAVKKVPSTKTSKFFTLAHEFILTPPETSGHAVLLFWTQGGFVAPKPRFKDVRAQRALASMLLGDIAPLKKELASGLKASVKGNDNVTLLHFASEAGDVTAVDLLLNNGARVNATEERHGGTPLLWAAEKGRLTTVRRLLAAQASVNARDSGYQTPLHEALQAGHLAVAQALIEQQAEVNAVNNSNESPYSLAIDNGYADLATLMLAHGAKASRDAGQTQRVLHTQARKGNTAMVRFLIGQKVNVRFQHEGSSPLSVAATAGDGELAGVLLAAGANVNDVNREGQTALMLACGVGQIGFVRTLLDAGADVSLRAKNGKNCLHYAAIRNIPGLIELLLSKGADPRALNDQQLTPLDVALLSGSQVPARALAAHGATIDLKSPQATTLLEAALKMDVAEVVRSALAAGWPPNARFREIWPALLIARAMRAKETEMLLRQAGGEDASAGAPLLVPAAELDAKPRLVEAAMPYDPRDPDANFPATVVELEVVIDPQGRAQFPVLRNSPDELLGFAALQAIETWRFTPPTQGGQPVCSRLIIPMEFAASTELAFRPTEADILPVPIKREAPDYPRGLVDSSKEGRVNLAFTVGKDGRTKDIRVLASSEPGFHKPAIEAVMKWVFRPGVVDGQPADIRLNQEIIFNLQ